MTTHTGVDPGFEKGGALDAHILLSARKILHKSTTTFGHLNDNW